MSAPEYHAASAASAAALPQRAVRALEVRLPRRARRIGAALLAFLALYSVAGFVGVPLLMRHIGAPRMAAALERPLSVGPIRFNPYTLRTRIGRLRIGERGAAAGPPVVDIARIRMRLSWSSLTHFAPVIGRVTIDRPVIQAVRDPAGRINVSDLLAVSRPPRFAVSNLEIHDGEIDFDDRLLGQKHAITNIEAAVPFVSNLGPDAGAYVQPSLRMAIDGSPLEIAGKARPFATPPESVMNLKLRRLDLGRFAAYLPKTARLKIPAGALSAALQIDFVGAAERPLVRLSGDAAVDQLDLRDAAGAPLAELRHATAALTDVEPLAGFAEIGDVDIDGLKVQVVRNRAGALNFASLLAGATAAGPTARAAKPSPAFKLTMKSLGLTDGSMQFIDQAGPTPAKLALGGIRLEVRGLATDAQAPPASYALSAALGAGGAVTARGSLDAAHRQMAGDISLKQIDLPGMQAWAQSMLAATVASGKLSAQAKVRAQLAGGRLDVHAGPGELSLDNVELRPPGASQSPLRWKRLSVALAEADLAAHRATVTQLRADGVELLARRERDGALSLAGLTHWPQPAALAPWSYRVGAAELQNARLRIEDASGPGAIALEIAPLNLRLKDVSSDPATPIALEADGKVNGKTPLTMTGTATLAPPKAQLRIIARRVDLAPLNPYLSERLGATVKNAALTVNGVLDTAEAGDGWRTKFRGDAAMSGVRILDNASRQTFLVWNMLSARRIELDLGPNPPRVHVGALALNNFYTRLVLSRQGRLNLRDIMGAPNAAPAAPLRAAPDPAAESPAAQPAPIAADLEFGGVSFERGRVNFTDNFIQPNYSANLTDVSGRIGAFGTRTSAPAEVALRGAIDSSAPVEVQGRINPLAPMASVDIRARAEGVELPNLSAYSTRYTGYPITRGTLSADVRYLLERQRLTAENHISIDQLTFGDKVETPSVYNLPMRTAVALLKDSRGQINLNVPVSGSLSDPQFSIGSLLWHALVRAVQDSTSSPFKLLAAAVGGEGAGEGGAERDYDHVDFAPGWATLTPAARSQLDTLRRALSDRPGVRLSITGRVDPAVDREGLREAKFTLAIREQKIKDLGAKAAGGADPAAIWVAPDEYGKYLWRAYKAADFPKPSNLIGMTTLLPQDEMKKLMLEHISVTDDDLRRLADARAEAVRKALAAGVAPERLLVTAPRLSADGSGSGKTTRADLALR